MREKGFDQLPVSSSSGTRLVGLVTLGNLLSYISSGRAEPADPVKNIMFDFTALQDVVTDPTDISNLSLTVKTGNKASSATTSESSGKPKRKRFVEITRDTPLSALSRFFEWNSAAVVTEQQKDGGLKAVAVVTKVDLLSWMVKAKKNASKS
jgi:cystathionine beta-synthase